MLNKRRFASGRCWRNVDRWIFDESKRSHVNSPRMMKVLPRMIMPCPRPPTEFGDLQIWISDAPSLFGQSALLEWPPRLPDHHERIRIHLQSCQGNVAEATTSWTRARKAFYNMALMKNKWRLRFLPKWASLWMTQATTPIIHPAQLPTFLNLGSGPGIHQLNSNQLLAISIECISIPIHCGLK